MLSPRVQKTLGILPFATDKEKLDAALGHEARFGTVTTDPIDTGKGKALVYRWTWEAVK